MRSSPPSQSRERIRDREARRAHIKLLSLQGALCTYQSIKIIGKELDQDYTFTIVCLYLTTHPIINRSWV